MTNVNLFAVLVAISISWTIARAQDTVRTLSGTVHGSTDSSSGVRSFKGIPYAAPPIGPLRWRAPQPVAAWNEDRPATAFGPRAMQLPIFGDMNFRSAGVSEDCLYLNVWTPADSALSAAKKLPVLVYFYGGGFVAGDGSEPRYDGEQMARHGIVAVTVNYRLGIFGFLAHPALTAAAPERASGNYGLLDQNAALKWVRENIAAFGGDPDHVTIAGESAGSFSVSLQMASTLSRGLFVAAIGESGAAIGPSPGVKTLQQAEADGVALLASLHANSAEALRAIPADRLLDLQRPKSVKFHVCVDGYFLKDFPVTIFAGGNQARVPLLAGVNSEEANVTQLFEKASPTVEHYRDAIKRLYPINADAVFAQYPATTDADVSIIGRDLASDRFIRFGTWKWIELQTKTSGQPTYGYLYDHRRPAMRPEMGNAVAGVAGGVIRNPTSAPTTRPMARGAVHSAEIEYALGNLESNHVYAWNDEDQHISMLLQTYFVNFIKTANPNGDGVPNWPLYSTGQRLVIDDHPHAVDVTALNPRYELLDRIGTTP